MYLKNENPPYDIRFENLPVSALVAVAAIAINFARTRKTKAPKSSENNRLKRHHKETSIR